MGEVHRKTRQISKRSHLNTFRRRVYFTQVAQKCGEFEFRETSRRKLKNLVGNKGNIETKILRTLMGQAASHFTHQL